MGASRVPIAAAAALFDLPASTVRWWERAGVLPPPDRAGGRRRYDYRDLRRLGLAYLCCVTGMMPLDKAAVVTTGRAGHADWQREVRHQIGVIEERIRRLHGARSYLEHLLTCTDDDPAGQCPMLEKELRQFTPRGRIPVADLLAAAEYADAHRAAQSGDETSTFGDETCPVCAAPLDQPDSGRKRRYCSAACRQRAYRSRVTAAG